MAGEFLPRRRPFTRQRQLTDGTLAVAAACVVAVVSVAVISVGVVGGLATETTSEWYRNRDKSSWQPPGAVAH